MWRESLDFSVASIQLVGRKNMISVDKRKPPTLHCLREAGEQAAPYFPVGMLLPSAVGEQLLAQ